ncbi:DUF2818 family protein [Chitinibacter sp. GC72]|uniref:DUF2818 family protein n=1 Tax=Chitinibacter sp. GC72 TaxID=1526917 RepID=UPI001E386B8D|nr:DUF2818 family protein [Chitinibacter sp. GC72]
MAANLPFLTEKILFVLQPKSGKKLFFWRVLELGFFFVLLGFIARLIEGQASPVHAQNWQFYASTLSLFLVLAWPGFVWRFFWRKPGL